MTSRLSDEVSPAGGAAASAAPSLGVLVADALRYWERRRLLYNVVLAAIVLGYFAAGWPESRSLLTWDSVLELFALAVLANVCYCAAYGVDLFVQLSAFRDAWSRSRWILLAIGLALAAVITRFVAIGLFLPYGGD